MTCNLLTNFLHVYKDSTDIAKIRGGYIYRQGKCINGVEFFLHLYFLFIVCIMILSKSST